MKQLISQIIPRLFFKVFKDSADTVSEGRLFHPLIVLKIMSSTCSGSLVGLRYTSLFTWTLLCVILYRMHNRNLCDEKPINLTPNI